MPHVLERERETPLKCFVIFYSPFLDERATKVLIALNRKKGNEGPQSTQSKCWKLTLLRFLIITLIVTIWKSQALLELP